MIKKSSNAYLRFILIVVAMTTVLIVSSIVYIINTTFALEEDSNYKKAFKWQAENKGVVGITVNISSEYKQRMLEWRIAKKDADTIILGSSTMMGIQENMFKKHTVFNGASNSNPLYYTMPVAKYHSKNSSSVKNIIMGFDWAIGLPYWKYKEIKHNPVIEKKTEIKLIDKIKDAVSYQRAKIVLSNIVDHMFADSITQYKCPTEDNIGTDQFFKTDQPKRCNGFRFDGSVVFPDQTRVSEKKWKEYLGDDLKKYQKNYDTNLGTLDIRYLNDFKKINQDLKRKGGKLIIFIPPLIQNATATMEQVGKQKYSDKMNRLVTFAKENNISIFDASKSEEYGCKYSDFLDAHHAFPSCYKKIIDILSF